MNFSTVSVYPWSIVLLACKVSLTETFEDKPGTYVYKFPSDQLTDLPGLSVQTRSGIAVLPQLIERIETWFERKPLVQSVEFVENYVDEVIWTQAPVNGKAGLYVANWKGHFTLEQTREWSTIPDVLRALPSGKARLTYLRAFQVLQGGLNDDLQAIESKDLKH